ncbi:MAG: hypothetical protein IBX69_16495 [Anaerolineales bacterium]|nr:hypothetical protein [Anaerolineales bacterium]
MPYFPTILRTLFILVVLAGGCTSVPAFRLTPTQEVKVAPTLTPPTAPTWSLPAPVNETNPVQDSRSEIPITNQRLDGNRLVTGSGGMPVEAIDIPLLGKPLWVVAASVSSGSIWAAALENGQVQMFQVVGDTVSEITPNVSRLPAGMPPVLQVAGERTALISPAPDASAATNAILLEDGAQAYIDAHGQLRLIRQEVAYTLAADALPDARILSDGEGRLLFLSTPTSEYPHGVLGDEFEAKTITLVNAIDIPDFLRVIWIDPGDVIEGIAPIWVDLDGDGSREIIVTQSNARSGARLVVYNEDGSLFASGESIGQGFRWRHQLAVGQFIAGGSQEIAVIRTPHIGGVIEIYAVEQDRLVIQAELSGYSSHLIGSRNLDGALAADLDGDGQIEIVVPDQSHTILAGIEMVGAELKIAWEASIGGRLTTNITAVQLPTGKIALGVGHDLNRLRIWLP